MTLKKLWPWLLGFAALLVLAAPVLVYISHFSLTISSEHSRWAEMGAAMSGIYAPLLAFATLCILTMQFRLQHRQQQYVESRDIINAAYNDVMAAIQVVVEELEPSDLHRAVKSLPDFSEMTPEDLELNRAFSAASLSNYPHLNSRLIPAWQRIYLNLDGLKHLPAEQSKLRLQAASTVSYEMAIFLDRLHYLYWNNPGQPYMYDQNLNKIKAPEQPNVAELSTSGGA